MLFTCGVALEAASKEDECQELPVGVGRAVCYNKQKEPPTNNPTPSGATPKAATDNSADQSKLEDEKLTKKLKAICRGC